jgi:hypothetical protein
VPNDDLQLESPSQPQSPSPSSPAAASSPASGTASRSEPPGFIGDAGPQFDPERAAAEPSPAAPAPEPAPLIEWEEDTIRALLTLKGRALHAGIGVADDDWRYTELDLAAIAPPLTRIANRYEPVQRLAKHADPLILLFALGGYGVRSLEERAAVLRALEPEADTVPIEPLEEPGFTVPPQPPTPQGPPPANAQAPPPRPPRPAEADVDPEAVNWQVGS